MAGSQLLWDVLLDIPGASFVTHGRQLSRGRTRRRAWFVVLAAILRSKEGLEYEDMVKLYFASGVALYELLQLPGIILDIGFTFVVLDFNSTTFRTYSNRGLLQVGAFSYSSISFKYFRLENYNL